MSRKGEAVAGAGPVDVSSRKPCGGDGERALTEPCWTSAALLLAGLPASVAGSVTLAGSVTQQRQLGARVARQQPQ